MKNPILRILISAILFTLISGIVVSMSGSMLGSKTSTRFRDGFFRAGAAMISCGLMSILGRLNQPIMPYTQPTSSLGKAERARQWAADISQGHNILAILVGRPFQPATGYELPIPTAG